MKYSKLLLRVLVSVLLFLSVGSIRAAEPGIYMLFVWGTNDPGVRRCVEISQRKIENAFVEDNSSYAQTAKVENYLNTAGGLAKAERYVKRAIVLKGANASAQNILRTCRELADAAGPNDAVMVYILCHGATIKGSDGIKRHALAPKAEKAESSYLAEHIYHDGILCGSIMKEIKSKPHRLNVLITDSCSTTLRRFEPEPEPNTEFHLAEKNPYLLQFLLKANGNLNVNSSRPETGVSQGELARGLQPTKWESVPDDPEERNAYENYAGTVFTNAFLEVAELNARSTDSNDYTVDAFFEKLRDTLDLKYQQTKDYLSQKSQVNDIREFMQQSTQTLVRYDDDSVVFSEDLDYKSKHEGVSSAGNNNEDSNQTNPF